MTDIYKKISELNSKYGNETSEFEEELVEHLKKKFPEQYKLTIEAKKKDEPEEDPEDITPGRIGEYMGDREDEFVAEYESALKNLVENGSELEL